jgi:hypothetical protein
MTEIETTKSDERREKRDIYTSTRSLLDASREAENVTAGIGLGEENAILDQHCEYDDLALKRHLLSSRAFSSVLK